MTEPLVPEGKDPSDKGDCEDPRSLTIHLYEDRWGNHHVKIYELTALKHHGVVPYRGSKPELVRAPFSRTAADVLPRILKMLEEG